MFKLITTSKQNGDITETLHQSNLNNLGGTPILNQPEVRCLRNTEEFRPEFNHSEVKGIRFMKLFSSKIMQVVIFMALWSQTLAFYPSEWGNGYFEERGDWVPWDGSCKTWLDFTTWETWEDFMRLNGETGLWESCDEDEYYDPIRDSCLSWIGVWTHQWRFQASCFECSSDKIFDIETLECVDSWDSDKLMMASNRMNTNKVWKMLSIYVDPESQEPIELGTLEYPYRAFKSAAAEILNHYSNTQAEVTIFVKDGFIEMDDFYFINMMNVKITAHPEFKALRRRAQISFTSQPQHGISKRARFHLLKDTTINYHEVIMNDEIGEREASELLKDKVGIFVVRTSLEISEIEFHSNELKYFSVIINLQDKDIKLCKSLKNNKYMEDRLFSKRKNSYS